MISTALILAAQLAAGGAPKAKPKVATVEIPPGIVSQEFIYESAPFPECHASTLVETAAGTLMAAWFGGTEEKHPDVCIWTARRSADGWAAPVKVADGLLPDGKRVPTWNPVLFQPKDGPLLLFYKAGPAPDRWWGLLRRSSDDGLTWSEPERLPDGIAGPVKNKPVQLPGGDIISGSSSEDRGWRVHFERSSDGGKSWTSTGPLHDGKKIAAIQPSILLTGGGNLLALGRSRQGRLWQMTSADAGKTWSPISLTTVPNPSSGTDALTLSDGRHLLVCNPVLLGRSPLCIGLSTDGLQWSRSAVLAESLGQEFSYPACIQTRDGLVHVSYTWKRQRIRHAVIDPKLLVKGEPLTAPDLKSAAPAPGAAPSPAKP